MPKADVVLTNGRVFSAYGAPVAEAVALAGGRVLAVGRSIDIAALIGAETKVVDLAGRLATPGLYEAHMHLLPLGLTMLELDARPAMADTLDGLIGLIAAAAKAKKPGEWVLARGYDQFQLDAKRHPTRDELDRAAPDNPVYLVRACGHISIVNSAALRLAGVDETTPVPQGGAIEQVGGRLTGLLAETGRDPIKRVLPDPSDDDLVAAIERGARHLNGFGFTSCMDAAVGMRAGFREIAAYRSALAAGRMPIRTNQCLLGADGGIVEECFAAGLITGAGDDMLSVGPVKIFTDGSAGGRTAAMSEPYLGEPSTKGLFLLSDAEMDALTLDYHAKGYQLAVHAIGDAAIEQTLRAMEKALAKHPDPHRRHRIEHSGFHAPGQIERMAAAGIEAAPQPVFIYEFGDLYASVAGDARAQASYPMRRWLDAGLKPSASSDAPVCNASPFPNFYSMLTRKTQRGTVIGADQTISIEEALRAFTEYGAYANRQELHRGRLAPGMAGDVAVFSRDLLTATPEEILRDTRCDLTLLAGKPVFDRHGEMAA